VEAVQCLVTETTSKKEKKAKKRIMTITFYQIFNEKCELMAARDVLFIGVMLFMLASGFFVISIFQIL